MKAWEALLLLGASDRRKGRHGRITTLECAVASHAAGVRLVLLG